MNNAGTVVDSNGNQLLPALTILGDYIGVFGGWAVCRLALVPRHVRRKPFAGPVVVVKGHRIVFWERMASIAKFTALRVQLAPLFQVRKGSQGGRSG